MFCYERRYSKSAEDSEEILEQRLTLEESAQKYSKTKAWKVGDLEPWSTVESLGFQPVCRSSKGLGTGASFKEASERVIGIERRRRLFVLSNMDPEGAEGETSSSGCLWPWKMYRFF